MSKSGWASVHPRVGGEHLVAVREYQEVAGSSPRGRGTLVGTLIAERDQRFIPAWAGNTARRKMMR